MYFSKTHIHGKRDSTLGVREWDLLQMLVKNGADPTVNDADALVADLGKTVTISASGTFMRLD